MIDGDLLLARPLGLLALLPALLVIVWRAWWSRRRRPTTKVPATGPLRHVTRSLPLKLRWVPQAFGALALLLVAGALARPQARTAKARDVAVEGIDIVVSLDLSTSMRAADFKPKNRFYVAKEVLQEFIESRPSDRLGLVVFAAEAYTQCPLTLDHSVLHNIVEQLRLGVMEDGTAIGDGIATALNRLRESDAKSKVVILITDGDNNSGSLSPMQAAALAKQLGIKVFTIMVGRGGKVPYPAEDAFGRTSYVEMDIPTNPELLKQVAQEAGGTFTMATDRESLRQGLQDILDSLEKTKLFESGAFARHDELFWLLLWPALGLALLDLTLRATRLRSFP